MIRSIFRHRCVVERDDSEQDEFGAEVTAGWGTHLEALPCRFWQRIRLGTAESMDASRTVATEDMRLLVPKGTDVTEADRILTVTNRLGGTIVPGPLRIDSIAVKSKFMELSVRGDT